MERNKLMRAGCVLAAAAVISTSAVSGTFAKYVTEGKVEDTARVAKWGVTVTAQGDGAFKTKYDNETNPTVVSESNVKVVAPGTSGTLAAASIAGKPEVAVKVSYGPTTDGGKILDLGDNWQYSDGSYYCPLKITVGGTEFFGMDNKYTSEADPVTAFENAVNTKIAGYTKNYAVGDDLSGNGLSITWEWAFEGTGTDAEKKLTDVKDTYLGDLAADKNGDGTDNTANDPTIALNLKVTVTQVD